MRLSRFLIISIAVAAVAFAIFTVSGGAASKKEKKESSWRSKISPDLLDQIDAGAISTMAATPGQDQEFDVIVQGGATTAVQGQTIQGLGGSVKKSYAVLNGLSARMSLRALQALASRPEFTFVSPDRPLQKLGHIESTTGAAQIRSLISGVNLDGSGVGIAILDSGIDKTVHDLSYNGNSRVSVEAAVYQFSDAKDYSGHGTHVAAIACGTGHVGPGAYTGVAPGAKIINVKVLDRTGKGYTSDLIDAVNWCVTYRNTYNIKIINMSLGAPAVDSYKNDPLCKAVRAAHDAGIVVVVAAGNNGKKADGTKLYGAIHSPGIEPSAITVGAANTYGTDDRGDDVVTTFSSRGPTRGYTTNAQGQRVYDNLIKPDLVAPGNKIIAAQAHDADLVRDHPQLDANTYETNSCHYVMYLSGTSVAAPAVSGAAALLLEANPSLTPNLIKAILMYSAQPLQGFNMLEQGAGMLNIDGAVRLARAIRNPATSLANGQMMLASSSTRLMGVPYGSSPPWASGSEYDSATDGNTSTYFDFSQSNGGYTGIDLGAGSAKKVVKIRFFPRSGFSSRMVGGKFQGSNTSQTSGFTDLYTVASQPAGGVWTEATISNSNTYRYLRYVGPSGGFCDIAEMEFITDSTCLPLAPQSAIAGGTFVWGQAVITNWSFLYGSNLMTHWQGMYGSNVMLTNGSYYSVGALWKSSSYSSSGALLSDGVLLTDGTMLADGVLVLNGQGTLLADGVLLTDGCMMADSRLTSDGVLLTDGTLMTDAIANWVLVGDDGPSDHPRQDFNNHPY